MRQIRHRPIGDGAAPLGAEGADGAVRPPRRKVSMRELLGLREDSWRPRLRGASLVAEADLRPDHTRQVATVLGRLYAEPAGPPDRGGLVPVQWPACLAAAMAGVAATELPGRNLLAGAVGGHRLSGHVAGPGDLGHALSTRAVGRLGMAMFPELPLHLRRPDPDARRHARLLPGRLLPAAAFPPSA